MNTGTIQNLIGVLEQAFEKAKIEISGQEIEELAVDIHRVLSLETRSFHTLEHVLSLTDRNAPIRTLAAVFHDLVYYQVDQGIPAPIFAIVAPYLQETDQGTFLVESTSNVDRTFELIRDLFTISSDQDISNTTGINEFLSALVAWKKLEHLLPDTMLLKIAVHIEATIPFRGPVKNHGGYFYALAERLKRLSLNYELPLSDEDIDETIQSTVALANQDVLGFAQPDPAVFLDNTWKLLPEINAELRSGKIYSIREYRQALQKMEAFIAWLEPQNIFHCYKDFPNKQDLEQLTTAAHRNIEVAREYLGVKLLAIAVLEALAEITGGDTPLGLFMGDIQEQDEGHPRLEMYLPEVLPLTTFNLDPTVSRLMSEGRSGQSVFDLQNAPLALYFYKCFGSEGCRVLLPFAQDMFAGNRASDDFLTSIDPTVISDIAQACAQMAPTRKDLLLQFASTITHG